MSKGIIDEWVKEFKLHAQGVTELDILILKRLIEKAIDEEYKLDPQGLYYRIKKRLFGEEKGK